MEVLDLAARKSLSDATMRRVMSKLYGGDHRVIVVEPTTVGVTLSGNITADDEALCSIFFGDSNELVLVPINCNGNHWCSIMINLSTCTIHLYDPMASSYQVLIRVVASRPVQILPKDADQRSRVSLQKHDRSADR
ncbi:unnamed protein product [Phytophthora fragariaefolia]|uniref:Unnamed protein product n=1 Tax=Phytophthora fragariaefolia TaxID=1490495 RepID=A0A9W7CTA3_9STRA|nr:unnamed protein product [Phytophthora fragariaefolia]